MFLETQKEKKMSEICTLIPSNLYINVKSANFYLRYTWIEFEHKSLKYHFVHIFANTFSFKLWIDRLLFNNIRKCFSKKISLNEKTILIKYIVLLTKVFILIGFVLFFFSNLLCLLWSQNVFWYQTMNCVQYLYSKITVCGCNYSQQCVTLSPS